VISSQPKTHGFGGPVSYERISQLLSQVFPIVVEDMTSQSGWWFGTFGLFFHILGRIIPTD